MSPGEVHTMKPRYIMSISRSKVKSCGPHCTCRACQIEWGEYWSAQREADELGHRDRLARAHLPATDEEWRDRLESWIREVTRG
jgi:hypothetical protein